MFYQILNPKRQELFTIKLEESDDFSLSNYAMICEYIFLYEFLKVRDAKKLALYDSEIASKTPGEHLVFKKGIVQNLKPYLTSETVSAEVFATVHYHYKKYLKDDEFCVKAFNRNWDNICKYFEIFARLTSFICEFTTDNEFVLYLSELMLDDLELICEVIADTDEIIQPEESRRRIDESRLTLLEKITEATGLSTDIFLRYEEDIRLYCLEWFTYQTQAEKPLRMLDEKYHNFTSLSQKYFKEHNTIYFTIA